MSTKSNGGTQLVDHLGNAFTTKKEMCQHWGVGYATFAARLKSGWTVEEALTGKRAPRERFTLS